MAHFDRGVYEPGEDIRVFDGSEDEDDAEGSRLPLLIVLALLVLAMFGGLVWLAYTQGVARGRTETPVLTAQNGPARVAPPNQGGAQEPYKGFKIYEQPAPPDDDADTTAAPSTPSVQALPATKPVPVAAAPSKPVAAPPVPSKAVAVAAPSASAPKIAAATPAPPAAKIAMPAAPAPARKLAAMTPAPPAKPAPVALKAAIGGATAPPRALAPMVKATPAPVAAGSASVLQIGAYKSQADADAAWKTYKAKHTALLADASDDVQQADLGDKGIWYRLRITGFPSKDVASAMCDRLKADGGSCFLGK
jgi:cell division protein FtsN